MPIHFEFYRYRFHFRALDRVFLPPGKSANVVRGAFGNVLHQAVPPEVYTRLFEPGAGLGHAPSGLADWPRPFVLRVAHLDGLTIPAANPFYLDAHVFDLHQPAAEELEKIGIDPKGFFEGTLPSPKVKTNVKAPPPGMLYNANPHGCHRCSKTGYTGRSGIYELLMIDDEIRQMALKNTDATAIKRAAVARGMRTLRDDGALKVRAGITTIEEVLLVTTEDRV